MKYVVNIYDADSLELDEAGEEIFDSIEEAINCCKQYECWPPLQDGDEPNELHQLDVCGDEYCYLYKMWKVEPINNNI